MFNLSIQNHNIKNANGVTSIVFELKLGVDLEAVSEKLSVNFTKLDLCDNFSDIDENILMKSPRSEEEIDEVIKRNGFRLI